MMCSRTRASPASALPSLHPLQFSPLIDLHNAIDLAIRVDMILSSVHILTIHIDGSDTEKPRLRLGKANSGSPVFLAVDFN